ncbi:MAG: DUF1810 family protein, partial [Pseudomonas stutzeri]|nr:DUF1810 family protein [Stutzerimonas stutzeri]
LGPRLQACTQAMLEHRATSAHRILGSPDDLKFHSCMTLFARTAQQPALFEDALQAFFDGQPDRATLERLDGC